MDRGGSCLEQHGVDKSQLRCMGSMQPMLLEGTAQTAVGGVAARSSKHHSSASAHKHSSVAGACMRKSAMAEN
jgi:hypothetical protein